MNILRHLVAFFLTITKFTMMNFLAVNSLHALLTSGQFQATTSFSTTFKLMVLIFLQSWKKKKVHRQKRKAGETYVACKAQSIYCLDFYRKYLSIPALWIPRNVIFESKGVNIFEAFTAFCQTALQKHWGKLCFSQQWARSFATHPVSRIGGPNH